MKKITLFICLIIVSVNEINAQKTGNTLFGGSLKYSSENIDEGVGEMGVGSSSEFIISPVVGFMVSDKIAIGAAFSYAKSKSDYQNFYFNPVIESETLTIAPFVRIHSDITESLKYYIEPSVGKTFVLGEDESEHKTNIFNAGVNFGLLYFFVDNLSLELNVGGINYVRVSDKDTDYKTSTLSIDYDLVNPNIGVKYYF